MILPRFDRFTSDFLEILGNPVQSRSGGVGILPVPRLLTEESLISDDFYGTKPPVARLYL
jgi:hypothetical protein